MTVFLVLPYFWAIFYKWLLDPPTIVVFGPKASFLDEIADVVHFSWLMGIITPLLGLFTETYDKKSTDDFRSINDDLWR